jgi:transposase
VETQCAPFYAAKVGRPSLAPGTYFRLLLIGYFEGIDSQRGIEWRTADSLALRGFLGLGLEEAPPEHTTLSRTLIDLEIHRAVSTWILQVLATAIWSKAKRSASTRRRSRPMRHCAASCPAIRARRTTNS